MSIYTVRANPSSTKAISIDQFPPEAWTVLLGRQPDNDNLRKLFQAVPWLNRGVNLRAAAISRLPFSIVNARGDEIDSSEDYQNVTGFLPGFQRTLAMIEMGLTLFGKHYMIKEENMLEIGRAHV